MFFSNDRIIMQIGNHFLPLAIFILCSAYLTAVNCTENSTTTAAAAEAKQTETTTALNSAAVSNSSQNSVNTNSNNNLTLWYGKKKSLEDITGCAWPTDFQERYEFCVKKYLPKYAETANFKSETEFAQGILNKNIIDSLVNCGNKCDLTIDRAQLESQIRFWWSNVEGLVEFKSCIKRNTEAVVRMCGSDQEVSNVMSGMAGLYLNLLDIIFDSYATPAQNETNPCAIKMAEAVHITAAMYITTQYYWQNSVLCWEVTSKPACTPLCKKFAITLQCVGSTCPLLSSSLPRFGVWQWYFVDPKKTETTCNMDAADKDCAKEQVSMTLDKAGLTNVSQTQRLFDAVVEKYNEFKSQVETSLHIPFYVFLIIILSSFAVFIIIILLICLWYNGILGGRKTKVIRYAKLLDNGNKRLRVNVDETKSLTRDFDDVE